MLLLVNGVNAFDFSDGFDDGDISDWTYSIGAVYSSTNRFTNGTRSMLLEDHNPASQYGAWQTLPDNFTYFNFSANVYFVAGATGEVFQIQLQNETGGRTATMLFSGGNIRFSNGVDSFIAVAYTNTQWYNLNVYYDGTNYLCYVNGTEYCSGAANITTGQVIKTISLNSTVGATNQNLYVDELIVENLAADKTLIVTARNNVTTNPITAFNISLYYPNGTLFGTNETVTGSPTFNLTDEVLGNYSLAFSSGGFQSITADIEYLNYSLGYEFGSAPVPSIDITFYDDSTNSLITDLMYAQVLGETNYFSANTTTSSIYLDLGTDTAYTIKYWGDGYLTKFYSLIVQNTEAATVSLYATNENSSYQNITATITDQNLYNLEGAILSIEKFNGELGQYLVSERIAADFEGKIIFKGVLYEDFYKFKIYYDSELVFSSLPTTIKDYELNFIVDIGEDVAQDYFDLLNLDYTLSYDNSTNRFAFTYSTGTGSLTGVKLDTTRVGSREDTLIERTISSSASGTIYHSVSNVTGYSYKSCAYGLMSGEYRLINCEYKSFKETIPEDSEDMFLFLLAILTVLFALSGLYSISLMLVVTPLPSILFELLGFTTIGLPIVLSVELLFIIIALVIDKN